MSSRIAWQTKHRVAVRRQGPAAFMRLTARLWRRVERPDKRHVVVIGLLRGHAHNVRLLGMRMRNADFAIEERRMSSQRAPSWCELEDRARD